MPEFEKIDAIEIRSEEVQEILGSPPSWIIRIGISILFCVIVIAMMGSWFFKYPDVIQARITLTTSNPPVSLRAFSSGKIANLFFEEKRSVAQGDVIAIIENTANYNDILKVKSALDTLKNAAHFEGIASLQLGDLQQNYAAFSRLLKAYNNFKKLDYYEYKTKSVQQQIQDYKQYLQRLQIQKALKSQELEISKIEFERDQSLYQSGIYAKVDFEKAEKTHLQQKLSFENAKTSLVNTQMQINQLGQQILDLKLQKMQEESRQQVAIEEALQNFKSRLKKWEQSYLVVSPIEGRVTFTKIWSQNQNVQIGEIVVTVIPNDETDIIGKVDIPAAGVGKLKVGQAVNIKFDNFPYMEFGLLRGEVKSISLVPVMTENGPLYIAEIEIPDSMISNYGKELKFAQNMTGIAEIITDDVRLLERFLNPIRSIWKKNVE